MLATVLWDGINPQEPSLVMNSGHARGVKRIAMPAEPVPAPQEADEMPITRPALMTFAPSGLLEVSNDPPLPTRAPAAPGPLIEDPDLPSNFV